MSRFNAKSAIGRPMFPEYIATVMAPSKVLITKKKYPVRISTVFLPISNLLISFKNKEINK
ncbi:hypothetical protein HOB96_01545 [bacterium]|nr:hypothetical protein [bacterium]